MERVILARRIVGGGYPPHRGLGTTMPLEIFVHGALCTSLTAGSVSPAKFRSAGGAANRGQCASQCLPTAVYDLIVDGQKKPLGDKARICSVSAGSGRLRSGGRSGEAGRLQLENRRAAQEPPITSPPDHANLPRRPRRGRSAWRSHSPFPRIGSGNSPRVFRAGFNAHGFFDGVNHQRWCTPVSPEEPRAESRPAWQGKTGAGCSRRIVAETEAARWPN